FAASFSSHPAPHDLYTLSLHDALPILPHGGQVVTIENVQGFDHGRPLAPKAGFVDRVAMESGRNRCFRLEAERRHVVIAEEAAIDRKSTRLNSSHLVISYAVFCLKKKK